MKIKTLSLVVGAIALSLTLAPLAVKAERTTSSPLVVAQAVREKGPFQKLQLTDSQQEQIQEIRRTTRTEIDKVLNDQQREQLKTAMQNRQGGWRRAFASLNLSQDQKNQIRQLMRSQKSKIEAVLTDEQKAQLQKMREEMRSRRQQRQQ